MPDSRLPNIYSFEDRGEAAIRPGMPLTRADQMRVWEGRMDLHAYEEFDERRVWEEALARRAEWEEWRAEFERERGRGEKRGRVWGNENGTPKRRRPL